MADTGTYDRGSVVDLHCHLLPGIDDGPADADGAVALARALAAGGVRTVAATPHLHPAHPGVVPVELAGRCRALRERLAAAGVELELVSGGEVDLLWALEAGPDELRLVSYGGGGADLLVETPYGPLPTSFEDMLFRLTLAGFRLLLAHPERNPSLRDDPPRLAELVRRGTLVQVTATSLATPARSSRSARFAHWIVEQGLAHVIASDSHGPHARRAPLAAGREAARALVGARADWMVEDAPAAVLAGEPLPSAPSPPERPRGLLRRLRR